VHKGDSEVLLLEFISKVLNFFLGVTVNNTLLNFDIVIQLNQGIKLPFFLIDGDIELLDTVQGEFFILHQDTGWLSHELLGDLKDLLWHSS